MLFILFVIGLKVINQRFSKLCCGTLTCLTGTLMCRKVHLTSIFTNTHSLYLICHKNFNSFLVCRYIEKIKKHSSK